MKLIKINEEHYIIVDDSNITQGDWHIKNDKLITCSHAIDETSRKITHSTLPLEGFLQETDITTTNLKPLYDKVKPLPIQLVKDLLGEKSYTLQDIYDAFNAGVYQDRFKLGDVIERSSDEWEVEFMKNKLKFL